MKNRIYWRKRLFLFPNPKTTVPLANIEYSEVWGSNCLIEPQINYVKLIISQAGSVRKLLTIQYTPLAVVVFECFF